MHAILRPQTAALVVPFFIALGALLSDAQVRLSLPVAALLLAACASAAMWWRSAAAATRQLVTDEGEWL